MKMKDQISKIIALLATQIKVYFDIYLEVSSQDYIITAEQELLQFFGEDAFKIHQSCNDQKYQQKCENGLQISQNQNKQINPLFDQSDDLICYQSSEQQKDVINYNNLQLEKQNTSNEFWQMEEEIAINYDSDFINKNEDVQQKAESKNQKIETIKEQMDHIDQEYQASILEYQQEKQKEILYLKEQSQIKLNENEIVLNKLIEAEKIEQTIEYKKQSDTINNIIEKKKQIILQQLDEEFIICLEREKMLMAKQLEDDLENYKKKIQKSNQSKLNLLKQKLYLNHLINMKKIFQKKNCNINKNNQIEISEKMQHLQNELNQYRIQVIESIEKNIQLLDQQNIVKLNKEKAILIKEYNLKKESKKCQLSSQIIQQQNKKKQIENHIKQIFKNQLIDRRNLREQQFQEELKNIQNRELKQASQLNLDYKDKEVKQIQIDNLKQFLFFKQQLNDRLTNNFDLFKKDLLNKYQIMKSNLVELYIEKLEKQKNLYSNNRQHQFILEIFQETIKKQKFINEISENIKSLKIQKQKIEQQLEDLQMATDQQSLEISLDQIKILNSDIEQLNNNLKQYRQEDKETSKEFEILQRNLYKLVSNHNQKQYKSQLIYYILQNINELNDYFNVDKIDLGQDKEIEKFLQQQLLSFKIEGYPQYPLPEFVKYFDETNFKQIKKWKAFLLNQRIIWIWEDEMCQREIIKLKQMSIKLNKDIRDIEKEFQQQNIIKKKNEFKLDFLEKQGQILKYQQSQIVLHEQKANLWKYILKYQNKVLDKMNAQISDRIPIQKSIDALKKLYTQYIQIQQDNEILPQKFQVEDLSKYKFKLPNWYSFLSQKQNFDLQYILLI
ncbi:unnamed protein product [Paramecium primaurelia]|uniref:Uncharacterized protein n=1 Tax=Paramecium primaurelia TaxID=5886 RepID=A0A8S1M3B5_PARPR|nr:unnamed protein product [Paramecium primaurelia]